MKAHRQARVAEIVREVASETILFEMQDPRVKMVTVTRAEVSGDLQLAKVYVSLMGSTSEQKLTLHGLKNAAGFIQSKLAKRLKTRYTPTIQFVEDQGVKKSIEISRLIREALDPDAEGDPEAPTGSEDADEMPADTSSPEETSPETTSQTDISEGSADEPSGRE